MQKSGRLRSNPPPSCAQAELVIIQSLTGSSCVFIEELAAFWGVGEARLRAVMAKHKARFWPEDAPYTYFVAQIPKNEVPERTRTLEPWEGNKPGRVHLTVEGVERLAEIWTEFEPKTAPTDDRVFESLLAFIDIWFDYRDGGACIAFVNQEPRPVYPYPPKHGQLCVPLEGGWCRRAPQELAVELFRRLAACVHLRRAAGSKLDPADAEPDRWRSIPLGLADWKETFTIWGRSIGPMLNHVVTHRGRLIGIDAHGRFDFLGEAHDEWLGRLRTALNEGCEKLNEEMKEARQRVEQLRNPSGDKSALRLARDIENDLKARIDAVRIKRRRPTKITFDVDAWLPHLFAYVKRMDKEDGDATRNSSRSVAESRIYDLLDPPGFPPVDSLDRRDEFPREYWDRLGLHPKRTPHLEFVRALFQLWENNWYFDPDQKVPYENGKRDPDNPERKHSLEDMAALAVLAIAKWKIDGPKAEQLDTNIKYIPREMAKIIKTFAERYVRKNWRLIDTLSQKKVFEAFVQNASRGRTDFIEGIDCPVFDTARRHFPIRWMKSIAAEESRKARAAG